MLVAIFAVGLGFFALTTVGMQTVSRLTQTAVYVTEHHAQCHPVKEKECGSRCKQEHDSDRACELQQETHEERFALWAWELVCSFAQTVFRFRLCKTSGYITSQSLSDLREVKGVPRVYLHVLRSIPCTC